MHALALNGSPRTTGNTAALLRHALDGAAQQGAVTEFVNLGSLRFEGCRSCFACKRKDGRFVGRCALRDDATPVLERASESDVVLLGSPVYLSSLSGLMKSFFERLVFPNLSYDDPSRSQCPTRIATGFVYTMGMPHALADKAGYPHLFDTVKGYLELLRGPSDYVVAADTYQFDDYRRYAASNFDEARKARVRAEQFPRDCQAAFDLGARLAAPQHVPS